MGIDVCLTCFNGGCLDETRQHSRIHHEKSGHAFALNVKRKHKPSAARVGVTHSTSYHIELRITG